MNTKTILARAAVVVTAAGGLAVGAALPAEAWQRYHVTMDAVALRSGPETQYTLLARVNAGTPVDIECQVQGGTNVNGNATWDRLTGGQWIADYFTSTPSFNSYAPGIPDCGAAPAPQPARGSREGRAVQWAQSQMGRTGWNGRCDRFVANAYGRANSGYDTAFLHYQDLQRRGEIHVGDRNVPRGALAFFGRTKLNGDSGHVMISSGGGNFVSTASKVRNATIAWAERYSGPYLGWAWANAEWAGR